MNFTADHEARGIPEIVSEGRPQAVRTANRIARANRGYKPDNTGAVARAAKNDGSGKLMVGASRPTNTSIRSTDAGRDSSVEGKAPNGASRSADNCTRSASNRPRMLEAQQVRRAVLHALLSGELKRGGFAASCPAGRHRDCLGTCSPSVARFGVFRFTTNQKTTSEI